MVLQIIQKGEKHLAFFVKSSTVKLNKGLQN